MLLDAKKEVNVVLAESGLEELLLRLVIYEIYQRLFNYLFNITESSVAKKRNR